MSALLVDQPRSEEIAEATPEEFLESAIEPEARVVLRQIGWDLHLALDKALGDDRPGPRFYYLDGDLEIMSTSDEHERLKTWISDFIGDYLLELGVEVVRRGQATMRVLKKAGAEPDDAWCIGGEKKWPDIVLEIALTSGGLPKLELYRRFPVPEVWFWRHGSLEFHVLRSDGTQYDRVPKSRLFPDLPVVLIERCVSIPSWRDARKAFRAGLA